MKSILLGAIAAIVVAIGAYTVLDENFQRSSAERYTTQGARL